MRVARSNRVSSTESLEIEPRVAAFLGGFIAGEGYFSVVGAKPRFIFGVNVAARDLPLLESMRATIGAGSIRHKYVRDSSWLPQVEFVINGRIQHLSRTVPFMDRWLPMRCAKRDQFERWRERLLADLEARPLRVAGTCNIDGCDRPVRGRGLCRRHYYRATGY